MSSLILAAECAEDLQVISARLQDSTARLKDLAWLPGKRRFAALFNRFRWEEARGQGSRVKARLYFDGVLNVQSQNLKHGAPNAVVSLLAIQFTPGEAPGGVIELLFAGGGTLRLEVECIEAALTDLTQPWAARARPDHEKTES